MFEILARLCLFFIPLRSIHPLDCPFDFLIGMSRTRHEGSGVVSHRLAALTHDLEIYEIALPIVDYQELMQVATNDTSMGLTLGYFPGHGASKLFDREL